MSRRRGKIAAMLSLAVALPVALTALWRPAVEAWYLHQLESTDPAAVKAAVKALDRMRCFRAIRPVAEAYSRIVGRDGRFRMDLALLRDRRALKPIDEAFQSEKVNEQIREALVFGLAETHGSRCVSVLERGLASEDWSVRDAALDELSHLGPLALEAEAGIRALNQLEPSEWVTFGLEPQEERLEGWESQDADVRFQCYRNFFEQQGFKSILRPVLRGSWLRDTAIWRALFAFLNGLAMDAQLSCEMMEDELSTNVARLLGNLDDDLALDKGAVIRALGGIGPAARDALPAIRAAITDGDPFVRIEAAYALVQIDPESSGPVQVLLDIARDRLDAAGNAIEALGKLGPRARAAAPVLLELRAAGVRPDGCRAALLAMGPDALAAQIDEPGVGEREALIDLLLEMVQSRVTSWGARAAELVLPWLTQALTATGDEFTSIESTLESFQHLGPAAAPVVPVLLRLLRDRRPPARVQVAWALASIGSPAVDGLADALSDPDEDVRALAAFALSRIGRRASRTADALRARLDDPSQIVRLWAERAIAAVDRRG